MGEYGLLKERKARLEIELSEEEFLVKQLDDRKERAIVGLVANLLLSVIIFVIAVFILLHDAFAVGGMMTCVIAIAWFVFTLFHEKHDITMLAFREFDKEKERSVRKQNSLKTEIAEIDEKMRQLPVTTWRS